VDWLRFSRHKGMPHAVYDEKELGPRDLRGWTRGGCKHLSVMRMSQVMFRQI